MAFNLGKVMRLPAALQLVPLWLVWTFAATELFEYLKMWRDDLRAATGSLAVALAIAILFIPTLTAPLQQRLSLQQSHGLLARYFVGQEPAETPPHLIRVDPQINFDNVAELGAMPFASSVTWAGTLIAPKAGLYRFTYDVDDNGWVTIDGKPVIDDPHGTARYTATGTIELSPGPHRIVVAERNFAGDSSAHLYWEIPGGGREVVPTEALIPDRFDPRRG